MAKLYISEYIHGPDRAMPPQEPSVTDQTPVAIGVASAQSAAFGAKTNLVRIHADAICSIAFGEDPTATADNKRMAAGATEYFSVGGLQKVAVITNT